LRQPTVLIISFTGDPHVDAVSKELERIGADWELVDIARLPDTGISIDYCNPAKAILNGKSHAEFRSIWLRRTTDSAKGRPDDGYIRWTLQEYGEALFGLLLGVDTYWVNHPLDLRRASYKPLQLQVAQSVSLKIPRTLITSSPKEAERFLQENGPENCVAKCLGIPLVDIRDPRTSVFTAIVGEAGIRFLKDLELAPCIFQEFVQKKYDVRATVVGDELFAAALHTEDIEAARVDWRHVPYNLIPHTPIIVPEGIARASFALCRRLNLRFAALDFVVSEKDDWYFLEANPAGQWLWIEDLTGLPIARAIAQLLVSGPQSDPRN
jgi:glutathione synthase/RimK-type ligase-like ATP-grasp enzyme